jgi:ribosomal protein S18 acetylase RimI-like enzyme
VTTLPDPIRKALPRYPTISAIYLLVIAFSSGHQGKGGGTLLLMDALLKSTQAADILGSHFLVLDSLNESPAKLYREIGFVNLPDHEPRMIMTTKLVRAAIAKKQITKNQTETLPAADTLHGNAVEDVRILRLASV